MTSLALVRMSWTGLGRHRLRALLTTLGIIIGVGAFIATVAIGRGAQEKVREQMDSMGTNMLMVWPGAQLAGGVRGGLGSMSTLTDEDAAAIERAVPTVRRTSPLVRATVQAVWGGANWQTRAVGVGPGYFEIRDWKIARGAGFSEADVNAAAKVCVLGQTVVQNLFPGDDPIGQTIRLRGMPCKVVGVLDRKGQSGMGDDQDDTIALPFSTLRNKVNNPNLASRGAVNMILMRATSAADTAIALRQAGDLLRQRHRIGEGEPDDFTIRDMTEIAQAAQTSAQVMTNLLSSIAAVSLLVGGIGIMNIMLVSVTERTREIGIRMALGAKGRDILSQFLVEAIMLCAFGGALGVAAGVGIGRLLADAMGWPLLVTAPVVLLGLGVAFAVGVLFGYYPAWRASRLDPIEALRYE